MIATRYFITIAALALVVTTASAAESFSVKALLMQALNAPDGEAKGIVTGKEADAIHAATGASDPIRAEVSTIKKFNQEGCSASQLDWFSRTRQRRRAVKRTLR